MHPPEAYSVIRTCKQCNIDFLISHSRRYYCDSCRSKTCQRCGNSFIDTPSNSVGTCIDCRGLLRAAPILTCELCAVRFSQRGGHKTKYCSQECRYSALRIEDPERGRRSWRYKQWRRDVIHRDKYICQRCGATNRLQAHHLKPWESNPELRYKLANGTTLCSSCHTIEHGGKPTNNRGMKRVECADCSVPLKGRGKSAYCQRCSTRHRSRSVAP